MGNLLIDAFTMDVSLDSVATVGKGNLNKIQKSSFHNLLTGILLWDKIEYPFDHYVEDKFKALDGDSLTKELCSIITSFNAPSFKPYGDDYNDWRSTGSLESVLRDKIEDGLIHRTQMYLEISTDKNIDYLPCPSRLDYLLSNERSANSRESLVRILEGKIKEYSQSSTILFNNPIIVDYIRSQVGDAPREQLACAIQLRKDKDVVALRSSLDKLERLYAPGTINNEKITQQEIDEISRDVFRKYSIDKKPKDFSLVLTSAFGVMDVSKTVPIEVGMEVKIPISQITRKRIINKKFLYRLLKFGINERK